MSLIIILFLFITLLIYLAFAVKANVSLQSSIDSAEVKASLLWLGTFFRADFLYKSSMPVLTAYIIGYKVYERKMQKKKYKDDRRRIRKLDIIRNLYLTDVDLQTSFGFDNPYATGITSGLIGIISQFINIDTLEQNPDYMADDDYIYVNATAKLNIGLTIVSLIRAYTRSSKSKLYYGTGRGG